MGFLVSSQAYPLEAAYDVTESRGLVPELVYILGRMGNARRALHLIVEQLRDMPRAIAFVQAQRDDDLWELLITLALASPAMTGAAAALHPTSQTPNLKPQTITSNSAPKPLNLNLKACP